MVGAESILYSQRRMRRSRTGKYIHKGGKYIHKGDRNELEMCFQSDRVAQGNKTDPNKSGSKWNVTKIRYRNRQQERFKQTKEQTWLSDTVCVCHAVKESAHSMRAAAYASEYSSVEVTNTLQGTI